MWIDTGSSPTGIDHDEDFIIGLMLLFQAMQNQQMLKQLSGFPH